MSKPLVSVVVTTRQSAETLRACLMSIKKQTYSPIEIIVVDRDSNDDTKAIAREFTTHVFNHGPERSAQRNFGVQQAKGTYVLIIDADMELSPTVVAECVDATTDPSSRAVIIPEESFGIGFWAQCKQLERSFYHGVDWIEAARFFEKDLCKKLGGYNETMVSGEDWDLSSRAGQRTRISRSTAFIYHNEGRLQLVSTLKKKFYYAGQFTHYTAASQSSKQAAHGTQPTGIVLKRFGLFFARPRQLFTRPHVGLGMLFMKVCEFGFGALGYLFTRYVKDIS